MTLAPTSVVGVGTDLVDVERLRAALDRQPGLAARLFTGSERDYASRHRDPVPVLAARFAAKEAAMKALGVGFTSVRFDEIGVVRADDGHPTLIVSGRALSATMGHFSDSGTVRNSSGVLMISQPTR